MSGETTRCFIAFNPPQHVVERCRELQEQLRRSLPDLRFTKPEQLHVTLVFLGELEQEKIDQMAQAVNDLQVAKETPWRANGLAIFSRKVIGLDLATSHQGEMVKYNLERAALNHGIEIHDQQTAWHRRFRPHLTLARTNAPLKREELPEIEPDRDYWHMQSITLYKSDLKPSGAEYTPLLSREL